MNIKSLLFGTREAEAVSYGVSKNTRDWLPIADIQNGIQTDIVGEQITVNDKIFHKDFLSIKEFADLVGMTVPTLRHYDNAGVFQPAKRGDGLQTEHSAETARPKRFVEIRTTAQITLHRCTYFLVR
jgi:hypothetical protein